MNAAAGSIPVALRAPYIDPAAKQHNSELIAAPPGLSKQWGPLQWGPLQGDASELQHYKLDDLNCVK